MSDMLIVLQSTEKPCTFSFKDTSLESLAPNLLYIPSKQN